MSLTSLSFLLFVAVVVAAYYACPKKGRWVVLLLASYAFYLISSAETFAFLLATTVVTFFGGKALGKVNSQVKDYIKQHPELDRSQKKDVREEGKKRKRKVVAAVLVFDFGILAALKYFAPYLEGVAGLLGFSFDLGILIPLGISFYTFQSASYIIDLYRDKYAADQNLAKFALFTSFFPQLIQGPIPRYDHLAGQLYVGHAFKYVNVAHGAQLMLWGFFKKLVIADRANILVNQVFNNHADYQGWPVFLALVFYTIVIYADFSGGVDIARGVARILGIDMSHNFKRPYFATSLSEFWRRWHMSLSFWTRDYIFFPISLSKTFGKLGKDLRRVFGDRVGKLFPVIIAQLCTFTVIGLWHGAAFKYVAYGWYNGAVIIGALLLEPYFKAWAEKLKINTQSFGWKCFSIFRTLMIVIIGRAFPRADSFTVALSMLGSLFAVHNFEGVQKTFASFGLETADYVILLAGCAIWFVISWLQEREENKAAQNKTEKKGIVSGQAQGSAMEETGAEVRNLIDVLPLPARWVIYLGGFTLVLLLGVYGPGFSASSFIYRGF